MNNYASTEPSRPASSRSRFNLATVIEFAIALVAFVALFQMGTAFGWWMILPLSLTVLTFVILAVIHFPDPK